MVVTPGIDTVVCASDCNGEYPVVFPEDREEIERLVLELPRKSGSGTARLSTSSARS